MFADEAIEKFFGQARQRSGGNFYIDVGDIKAAAATKNLHALLKYDVSLHKYEVVPCTLDICTDGDQFDITFSETEYLIQSDDTIKDKIIYLAGYLEHKYRAEGPENENEKDVINSEFHNSLNRGGLTIPLISTVHFVYSAYKLFDYYKLHCCQAHVIQLLSCIDSPMALIKEACCSMSNILLKAFVHDNSDRERQLGCLRRREKLSSN